jgi:branched-chain amino acid transport system permease protein
MKREVTKDEMDLLSRILDRLCLTPLGAVLLIVMALLPYIPPFDEEYMLRWLTLIALTGASAIAFDLTAGFINIVNFGFAAILGLGSYTSALLAVRLGLTPWVGIFAGAVAAGVLGFLTGVLTLRLRGIFAAVMAWFVGLALMGLAIKMVWLTRGPLGLRVPRLMQNEANEPYYYTMLIMLFVTYVVCRWTTRTKMGLAFKAIGQNMEAARTSGVNPTYYRVAYIGGRGSLWGGAFIAFPFLVAMELVRSGASTMPGLNLVIYGLILILVMIYLPGGVASLYYRFLYKPRGRFWRFMVGYRESR